MSAIDQSASVLIRAEPMRAPSMKKYKFNSVHTSRKARSSLKLYTVPISVDCEMYTTRGRTPCSHGCAATTVRTSAGVSLPCVTVTGMTLCPVASIAPVSLAKICPVCAEITASKGRSMDDSTVRLACVPPLRKCTATSGA